MKKAYLVDFAVLVRVVTDETDYDKIIELAAEKMKREYPVSELIENATDPVEDIEVPYEPDTPTKEQIMSRLEYLRAELRQERISYGELAELQSLAPYIEPGDTELLEAAGVPES